MNTKTAANLAIKTDREIYTVSEITKNIRFVLESNFTGVWIEGELSNFKAHSSGHMYFSLKDEASQIQCVMFRSDNERLTFELKEGLSVLCFGRVSVYTLRGQYQLYVERAEPKGIGALQLRFQQLKEKLQKEGLFDEARKREIPFMPSRIGIVTSIDGAALQDILKVLGRRFSNVQILICPASVQGATSAASIAQGIEDLNEFGGIDVMIVGRGGGSLEDLWAFNEEIVARAIFNSKIPVISAVGHEVDFTISDFVADLRAPTPSVAAEMVLPLKEDLLSKLVDLKSRSFQALRSFLKALKEDLISLVESRGLKDPLGFFEIQRQGLDDEKKRLQLFIEATLQAKKESLALLLGKLEALGPLATLRRGFSATLKLPEEIIISSFRGVKAGDLLKTKLSEGFIISQVKETQP